MPLCPPAVQRYIVRIIFMVPSYAITSYLSLVYRHYSIYFDTPRDWCVEGWAGGHGRGFPGGRGGNG